jgi:hypothetical protein
MPQVGFEPTILVFELVTTVHALDRAVTVIRSYFFNHTLTCAIPYTYKSSTQYTRPMYATHKPKQTRYKRQCFTGNEK